MKNNPVTQAEAYYTALVKKNYAAAEACLHPEVQFVSPLAKLKGKAAVFEAAKKFSELLKTLKIRAKFGSGEHAMLIYDIEFPEPIGDVVAAGYLTFKDGLIANIEMILDPRRFEPKKDAVFSK